MKERILIILVSSVITIACSSQTGGDNVYEFLNLTHSPLAASLGGVNVSVTGSNSDMAWHNPALLDGRMGNSLAFNYVNYFAGINYGMVQYSMQAGQSGNIGVGITYLNYGSFTEADPTGAITGSFGASEYAFSVIWSKTWDSLFTFGASLKPVISHLDDYTSFGFAIDLGALYTSPSQRFSAGMVLKNAGMQLNDYAGEGKEKIPFEIEAGISQRLAHAPFRFSLTLRHLEKFNLTNDYNDTLSYSSTTQASEFFENVFRHAIFSVELIPHKNFYISAGYNYQRRSELKVDPRPASAGISWGFGINTSALSVGFGRATYHLGGSSNHIAIVIKPQLLSGRNR